VVLVLRNGFTCLKNGGTTCYFVAGRTSSTRSSARAELHRASVRHRAGAARARRDVPARRPAGEAQRSAARVLHAADADASRENVLKDGELLVSIALSAGPRARARHLSQDPRSRSVDPRRRQRGDRAGDERRRLRARAGRARGVAPVPWRLPEVERMLTGQRVTPELAAKAGEAAVAGARPLAKNGYKVPMTQAMVTRTILSVAS